MKYLLVIFLTLFNLSYSKAAIKTQPKTSVLRSVFKPLSKKSDQIEMIRLYQDKSFEHLVYVPDRSFKGGIKDAVYYTVLKNTGKYSLESGKMKLTCLQKNFPCRLYEMTLFIDNSKVYDNRFRAIFKKKEYVLRSTPKEKYSQPYFIDPVNARIVTNEALESDINLHEVVRFAIKGETESRLKIKALIHFLKENVRFTQDEGDNSDELMTLLTNEKRKVGSAGLAKLFTEMLNIAGLPAKVVQGELKADFVTNKENKSNHSWNTIHIGNSDQLYDISLGERWMNVDPAIMIHSHYPEDPVHQYLETPISKAEFNRLAYTAPTRENAEFETILPEKGEVHIHDQMELLFSSSLSITHAEIVPLDSENAKAFEARLTSTSTSGKTRVVIPIKEKNALLKIRTSSGMELTYRIFNDGTKDAEIEGYYKQMRTLAAANRSPNIADDASMKHNTVHKTLNTFPAVFDLSPQFRSDVLSYQLTDFVGFDHPMVRSAVGLYGTKEIPGTKNNPKIVEFFHATGQRNIHDDETHWCSAFIMYCAKLNGYDYPKNALARSWMKVGEKVENPKVGDLVVFGWGQSYRGHVAIYLGESNGRVICLGGNQGDEVNVTLFTKECILGYRRLN